MRKVPISNYRIFFRALGVTFNVVGRGVSKVLNRASEAVRSELGLQSLSMSVSEATISGSISPNHWGCDVPRLSKRGFFQLNVTYERRRLLSSCYLRAYIMRISGLQKEILSLYRQCLRECRKKPEVTRAHFQTFAR
jgi:hypothetical protein